MRTLAVIALISVIPTQAFAAKPTPPVQENGWLIFRDSYITEAIPCRTQPILLQGNHTTIILNGMCSYVRVAGWHNDIVVEVVPAATIEITGEHNDVTWMQVVHGPPPRLFDRAASNTFHHGGD
jgi:hypothetical protein